MTAAPVYSKSADQMKKIKKRIANETFLTVIGSMEKALIAMHAMTKPRVQ
jgi:hypothetical protein